MDVVKRVSVRVNPVLVHGFEKRMSLDGAWQFHLDPDDMGVRERWFDFIKATEPESICLKGLRPLNSWEGSFTRRRGGRGEGRGFGLRASGNEFHAETRRNAEKGRGDVDRVLDLQSIGEFIVTSLSHPPRSLRSRAPFKRGNRVGVAILVV